MPTQLTPKQLRVLEARTVHGKRLYNRWSWFLASDGDGEGENVTRVVNGFLQRGWMVKDDATATARVVYVPPVHKTHPMTQRPKCAS